MDNAAQNIPTQPATQTGNIPPSNIPVDPDAKLPFPKWAIIAFLVFCLFIYGALIIVGYEYLNGSNDKNSTNKEEQLTYQSSTTKASAISGSVGINGIAPNGATISIYARSVGTSQYTQVVNGITAIDGAVWSWNEAIYGGAYEIQAKVLLGSQSLGSSQVLTVAAPAQDEVLNINIATPTPSVSPTSQSISPTPTPQILSAISGTLNLNGYIPSNATINIAARQVGGTSFNNVLSNLPAVDNATWSWVNAIQGATYEIQATLVANVSGITNPVSQVLTAAAPAANETLTINSSLTPPAPVITGVSGTINLNGSVPSGSYITIGARPTGTTTFNQIASNLSATNGTAWSWANAQSGQSYDFQAYLWINNQPASQSQILTIPAPATGEVLTINAQTQPNAPTGSSLSVSCSNNNGWQATITYNQNNANSGAQQFWLTVGTTGGGSQVVNNITTPSNPSQTQTYTTPANLTQGQTYYAQYAFSTCSNCNTFSSFSTSIPFTCN